MSESTQPAACTDDEFRLARAAGLLVVTTEDERAIHAFADSIRGSLPAREDRVAEQPNPKPFNALAAETEEKQVECIRALGLRPGHLEFRALDELCAWSYSEGCKAQQAADAKALDALATSMRLGLA
jgi:hypothetical protein